LDDPDLIEILDNDRLLLPSILSWLEYVADLFELLEDDLLLYLWLDDNEIIELLDDDRLVSLSFLPWIEPDISLIVLLVDDLALFLLIS
jgi:hypothetical protein